MHGPTALGAVLVRGEALALAAVLSPTSKSTQRDEGIEILGRDLASSAARRALGVRQGDLAHDLCAALSRPKLGRNEAETSEKTWKINENQSTSASRQILEGRAIHLLRSKRALASKPAPSSHLRVVPLRKRSAVEALFKAFIEQNDMKSRKPGLLKLPSFFFSLAAMRFLPSSKHR